MRPHVASAAAAGSVTGLLVVLAAPSPARAQTTMMTTSIQCPAGWTVSRENSPRASEFSTGTVGIDQSIGLRDCNCGEVLRIDNIVPTPGTGGQYIQFWVGNNAMACQTSTNRMPPSTGIQTCFQITDPAVPQSTPATSTGFTVHIPMRDIIDPRAGSCSNPPFGNSQTVYLSLLYTGTSDPSPVQTCTVTYNLVPPVALPTAPTATAQEGAVNVTWTIGTTADEAGTSSLPANVQGYYVLQFPGPANPVFDGGACDGSTRDVASTVDAAEASTGTDAAGDADLDGADADLDASTGVDAPATMDSTSDGSDTGSTGGGSCGSPPTIDPNDPAQFNQYAVTNLLPVATTTQRVTPLTNGQRYQFAIVVQDTAGNRAISPWSSCAMPQPVTDFWEQYRNRGGTVSPSICTVRAAGAPVPWRGAAGAAAALAASAALLARRRRRRERDDARGGGGANGSGTTGPRSES